jgi:hypothetical protein
MSNNLTDAGWIARLSPLFSPRKPLPWVILSLVIYTAAGFWLLPWVAKDQLPVIIAANYGLTSSIGEIHTNPFTLTVEIEDLSINDPDQQALLGFDRLVLNLETASIIHLALTLKELSVDNLYLNTLRYTFDDSNLQRALDAAPAADTVAADNAAPLPLLIYDINIREARLNIEDRLPSVPFKTVLGPVNITINELSTLPGRSGQQQVSIVTETGAKVSWNGSLELAPLVSRGNLSVSGPLLPLIHRYLEDQVTFDLTDGDISIDMQYELVTTTDGGMQFAADDMAIALTNTELTDMASGAQLLSAPTIAASFGSIRYPDGIAHFQLAELSNIAINSWINPDGTLNFSQLLVPQTAISTSELESDISNIQINESAESLEPETPWEVSLDTLKINNLMVRFEDRSLQTPSLLGLDNFNFTMTGISSKQNARFPFSAEVSLMSGGNITANGQVGVLPEPMFDAALGISALNLSIAQSYLSEFAKVRINSGQLSLDANLSSDSTEALNLRGAINIDQLSTQDLITNTELLSWQHLLVDDISLGLTAAKLEISKLRFAEPYVRLLVANDQSTNFADVVVDSGSEEPAATASESKDFEIQIGEIDIRDGTADFADNSLPLPFAVSIAELQGDISTVSTASSEPTKVGIKGRVDEYGSATISGDLYALDPLKYMDIAVVFDNINMPTLSPYTAEFVGRKIESGKLNVKLDYKFADSQMLGSNSVVLNQFTLGDKVNSKNAVNLPLGLAVALLKDKDDVIDINLEVAGDMNDPQFSVGRIVLQALSNLITKVATSPFRALGSLVGDNDIELDSLEFAAGTAELTPPDREKLAKLAQALGERPELSLVVAPVLDTESDRLAIQQAKVAGMVDAQMSLKEQREESPDMFVRRQRKALESLYRSAVPNAQLADIKAEFTRPLEENGQPTLDEVAYSAELRRRMVTLAVVSDTQLENLATERAERTVGELLINAESLQQRIRTGALQSSQSKDPQWVVMKMTIEVAEASTLANETTDTPN